MQIASELALSRQSKLCSYALDFILHELGAYHAALSSQCAGICQDKQQQKATQGGLHSSNKQSAIFNFYFLSYKLSVTLFLAGFLNPGNRDTDTNSVPFS